MMMGSEMKAVNILITLLLKMKTQLSYTIRVHLADEICQISMSHIVVKHTIENELTSYFKAIVSQKKFIRIQFFVYIFKLNYQYFYYSDLISLKFEI